MIYFFVCLVLVNVFLYYKNFVMLAFLLIAFCMLGKRSNFKLYLVCCLSILLFVTCNFKCYESKVERYEINDVLLVLEKYENYSIVSDDNNKYLVYNKQNNFNEGNKILFEGKLVSIKGSYSEFYKYLNKKNVNYELKYNHSYVVDSSVNLNTKIVNELLENKSEQTKSYLKLILFNVKDENNGEFYNNFSLYSLTYLIAVSGFHINLLFFFFKKIFKKNFVGLIFVSFYLYLLNFSVSSYRAFLCCLFKKINKKFDFNLSNLDVVALIGCVFIFLNPCIMFSFSFVYSFLVTFLLEIFKVYKIKKITSVFYIYLINVPLMLLSYYKLNLSSMIFNLILSGPISFLYIFSFIYLFLDKFYLLYEFVIHIFSILFNFLNNFNFLLIFGKPSVSFIIVYYLLLVLFFVFKEKKSKFRYCYLMLVFFLLVYQYSKPLLNRNEQVYFLNVGQGDCSVFFIPNRKEVVLVDTGGSKYKDIANNEIIPFLESKGIDKINKIILTHDDFDHVGALENLKKNFDVGDIIDTSLVEKIKIGNKNFKNLNVSEKRDNDGSIVLYGEYAGYKLILMGDASSVIEKEIVKNVEGVDIVKVGHHGSDSSSEYSFLESIGAKIAIISIGKNNNYGHPHTQVLENLMKLGYVIFRTDENNDIGFGKNIFNLSFVDYFR